ncbi:MAG TPA: hypothetical protein VHY22_12525 [Chthoniobacteraceae bacterium]|jgi:hypothetical protein|nr:hypothetical protein [Chthoniobacteraceae bacterium]
MDSPVPVGIYLTPDSSGTIKQMSAEFASGGGPHDSTQIGTVLGLWILDFVMQRMPAGSDNLPKIEEADLIWDRNITVNFSSKRDRAVIGKLANATTQYNLQEPWKMERSKLSVFMEQIIRFYLYDNKNLARRIIKDYVVESFMKKPNRIAFDVTAKLWNDFEGNENGNKAQAGMANHIQEFCGLGRDAFREALRRLEPKMRTVKRDMPKEKAPKFVILDVESDEKTLIGESAKAVLFLEFQRDFEPLLVTLLRENPANYRSGT